MMNALKALANNVSKTKINIQELYHRRDKATTAITSSSNDTNNLTEGQLYPIWQITVPLGIVLVFAIGAVTAYTMVEGRYIFELSITPEQLKMRTDVDKRESSSGSSSKTWAD